MRSFLFLFFFSFLASASVHAQKSLDGIFGQYSQDENASYVKMDASMLSYFVKDGMKSKLKNLDVVILDQEHMLDNATRTSMKKSARENGYDQLINVKDKDAKIDVLSKEKSDYLESVFMIVNTVDKSILVRLKGRIFLEELKDFNFGGVEGTEQLSRIFKQ